MSEVNEISIPFTLESWDCEEETVLEGTLHMSPSQLYFESTDGRKMAIDFDGKTLRAYGWLPDVDAPISIGITREDATVYSHDFLQDNGVLNAES